MSNVVLTSVFCWYLFQLTRGHWHRQEELFSCHQSQFDKDCDYLYFRLYLDFLGKYLTFCTTFFDFVINHRMNF